MKRVKRFLALALSLSLVAGTVMSTTAAGLRDVFNAKYYADQYADLKEAFGYDEEALYEHFLTFGLKEGRNMSPILDVVSYREQYADLDAAFGDNWDAYVQHYLDYGIEENRDNGTDFDVKAYVNAYTDVSEAFGNDYAQVVEHYLNHGMEENRQMGNTSYYVALEAAKEAAREEAENRPSVPVVPDSDEIVSDDGSYEYEFGNYKYKYEFDENGKVIKWSRYDLEDNLLEYSIYEYDSNGYNNKITGYDAQGNVKDYVLKEYDAQGNVIKTVTYNADGSVSDSTMYEYDADNNLMKISGYDANGRLTYVLERDKEGNPTKDTNYYADGTSRVKEYGENRVSTKETYYNADGSIERVDEYVEKDGWYFANKTIYYREDGTVESISTYDIINDEFCHLESISYNADGSIKEKSVTTYDDAGNSVKSVTTNAQGIVVRMWEYGTDGETYTEYDEEGNIARVCEYVLINEVYRLYKSTYYNADGSINKVSVSTYDDAGNRLKETTTNAQDVVIRLVEFETETGDYLPIKYIDYDDAGNITQLVENVIISGKTYNQKIVYYNTDGSVKWMYTNEYDANGTTIATSTTNYQNGVISNYCESKKFGDTSQITCQKIYDAEGNLTTTCIYEYNDEGTPTKSTVYRADGSVSISEYNDEGKLISMTEYDSEGNITYQELYDEQGNVIS